MKYMSDVYVGRLFVCVCCWGSALWIGLESVSEELLGGGGLSRPGSSICVHRRKNEHRHPPVWGGGGGLYRPPEIRGSSLQAACESPPLLGHNVDVVWVPPVAFRSDRTIVGRSVW